MQVGYEVVLDRSGRAEFRVFAPRESGSGRLPLVSSAGSPESGTTVLAVGRVYYRGDLMLPEADRGPNRSTAEIALALMRDHGPAGLGRLEGEISLVAHDARTRTLWLWRDPLGSWPLYYTGDSGGERIAAGTRLLGLCAGDPRRQVDPDYLARYLIHPFGFDEIATENTALRGVRRVPNGSLLALRPGEGPKAHTRWAWESRIPDLTGITLEDAAEGLRRRLDAAVAERVGSDPVAAHLSGGMDSASVVALACRHLASRGEGPLVTLSVAHTRGDLAGERHYQRMVAEKAGWTQPVELDAEAAPFFDWFAGPLPPHDEPCPGLYTLARARQMATAARSAGATVVLTGGVADEFLLGRRLYLADLLAGARWKELWREAVRCALLENVSLGQVLVGQALPPALPPRLRGGPGVWVRRGRGRWPDLDLFTTPPWVTPRFARAHGLRERFVDILRDLHRSPRWRHESLFKLRWNTGDWGGWYVGAPSGVWNTHPFLDPRVCTFCAGLPPEVNDRPGEMKPVLRAAMTGLVPDAVLGRRFKANTGGSYRECLAQQLPAIERMLGQTAFADLGVFDLTRLSQVIRDHAMGLGAAPRVVSALSLIAWYDHLSGTNSGTVPSRYWGLDT